MVDDTVGGKSSSDPANPVAEAARGKGRMAVVHHWDADGIASAAMVVREVGRVAPGAEVINTSPTIGRWLLDRDEASRLARWGPELVVIVDLAVREPDLRAILDGVGAPVLMVDHHRTEPVEDPRVTYHNPVALGEPEEESPSCTWVLMRLLDRPLDLLTVLGAFGDRGRGVVHEAVWPQLEGFLEASGLTEGEMHTLVDLVDSSAKRRDLAAVNAAVPRLLEGLREPRGLLDLPEWREGAREVERALAEQLETGDETEVGPTLVKTIDTPYLVISTAARRLVRTRDNPVVVVVNRGYSADEAQLYVRRAGALDLSPLIGRLRDEDLSAGGKSEVVGAIAPKGRLDEVLSMMLAFINTSGDDGENWNTSETR